MTNPTPSNTQNLSMSWKSITVSKSGDNITVQILDLGEDIILRPEITPGTPPTIQDAAGNSYALQDKEARFIEHALHILSNWIPDAETQGDKGIPFTTEGTSAPEGWSISWRNELGEMIAVSCNMDAGKSVDPEQIINAFYVEHSDIPGVLLFPVISTFGNLSHTIKGHDQKTYILAGNEANFINHAVRTLIQQGHS